MGCEAGYNLFQFTGEGVEASYSLSSLAGPPLLHYQDDQFDRQLSGDAIRTEQTEIGTLVTGTLEQIPDLRTVTVSLILPAFNPGGDTVQFDSGAIITTHKDNIAGPGAIQGALASYRVIPLQGEAKRVLF